jgi:hypothetical protein
VPARRISPRCGSKEARAPIDLKSDMPAAVFLIGDVLEATWQQQ